MMEGHGASIFVLNMVTVRLHVLFKQRKKVPLIEQAKLAKTHTRTHLLLPALPHTRCYDV
ncbi:hypothetical protein BC830DRAFT_1109474 [Chytriomyces sp. MP71]|nr:hypothetical protein BC830DRAFT_1109474 [Chytriomyces sp. MP71]